MDDVFYLCQEKKTVKDLANVLQSFKDIKINIFEAAKVIQINYNNCNMDFMFIDEDDISASPDQFLSDKKIKMVICICHHKSAVKEMLELVKALLQQWGGWLGNDHEEFMPIYNDTDMDLFTYE